MKAPAKQPVQPQQQQGDLVKRFKFTPVARNPLSPETTPSKSSSPVIAYPEDKTFRFSSPTKKSSSESTDDPKQGP